MKRISTPTRAINLFGAGKDGFKNGDLASGIQPTDLEADWFNQLQEEVARLIEATGIALDGNVKTQLLQAVRRMSGGYVRTVTAGHTVLTADDAGIVLVDATTGAVTIALPLANVLMALPFAFRRIDDTVNLVTVSVAGTGTDVIDDIDTSFTLVTQGDIRKIVSVGAAAWRSEISHSSSTIRTQRFIASGKFVVPAGVTKVYVSLCGGGGGGAGGAGSGYNYGGGGGGGAQAYLRQPVAVTPGTTIAVTIGGGGFGAVGAVDATFTNGSAGGTSSFGTLLSALGGGGGIILSGTASGGFSGGAGGGNGGTGLPINTSSDGYGGMGGASLLGSGANSGHSSGNAVGYGSGGAGGRSYPVSGISGSAGANGICIVEW